MWGLRGSLPTCPLACYTLGPSGLQEGWPRPKQRDQTPAIQAVAEHLIGRWTLGRHSMQGIGHTPIFA